MGARRYGGAGCRQRTCVRWDAGGCRRAGAGESPQLRRASATATPTSARSSLVFGSRASFERAGVVVELRDPRAAPRAPSSAPRASRCPSRCARSRARASAARAGRPSRRPRTAGSAGALAPPAPAGFGRFAAGAATATCASAPAGRGLRAREPRRTRSRRSRPGRAPRGPSFTSITREAMRAISERSCVTTTTAPGYCSSASSSTSLPARSRWCVGSSSSSRLVGTSSRRASATRWRSPPESTRQSLNTSSP